MVRESKVLTGWLCTAPSFRYPQSFPALRLEDEHSCFSTKPMEQQRLSIQLLSTHSEAPIEESVILLKMKIQNGRQPKVKRNALKDFLDRTSENETIAEELRKR